MLDQTVAAATRQFSICNACRYCEGLCSVFPAMETRTVFRSGDISYLSFLCHDCGACVPACPFSPPHEFAVDIRSLMADARVETFEEYAQPRSFWRVLARRRSILGIAAVTLACAVIVAAATGDPERIVDSNNKRHSFYSVIGWIWLVVPAGVISAFAATAIVAGLYAAAVAAPGGARLLLNLDANRRAIRDTLGLPNLGGGGGGCATVIEKLSATRRHLHHLIFYGFALMFLSTVAASFEQDILDIQPPYPLLSAPVLLGGIGGVATTVGVSGFIAIGVKRRSGAVPSRDFDRMFSLTLLAATVSGLLTLALRSTEFMGAALIIHLGTLGAFFLTLPYSKFVHGFYRYAALVRFHAETDQRDPRTPARSDLAAPISKVVLSAVSGDE